MRFFRLSCGRDGLLNGAIDGYCNLDNDSGFSNLHDLPSGLGGNLINFDPNRYLNPNFNDILQGLLYNVGCFDGLLEWHHHLNDPLHDLFGFVVDVLDHLDLHKLFSGHWNLNEPFDLANPLDFYDAIHQLLQGWRHNQNLLNKS